MSVFKRAGSPYYYTEFEIGGTRFLRSTKKTTEREAQAEAKRIRAQAAEAVAKAGNAKSLTIDQAFGRYWTEHAETKLAPTWKRDVWRYSQQILNIISPAMPVEDVDDSTIDDFVQARVSDGAGEYAINRALAVWRRVHNLAGKRWKQRTQQIDWSSFKNHEEKRVRALTHAEARALVAPPMHEDFAWPIRWSLLTGARQAETFSLEWDNVNVAEGWAKVIAKGGKQHTIWLSPAAIELLAEIPRRGSKVFRHGNRRKEFAKALARAGITDFRWHDLRHTFATWMRQAGTPVEVIQRCLGHEELSTTMRYAHVFDPEVQEAMRSLPSLAPSTPKIVSINRGKSAGYRTGTDD